MIAFKLIQSPGKMPGLFLYMHPQGVTLQTEERKNMLNKGGKGPFIN
jgi:hypothetical protein